MDCIKINKLLVEYEIESIEELRDILSFYSSRIHLENECKDDPEEKKKNCTNSKCYDDFFVPDCRKLIEIYNMYFKRDYKSKKLFIAYIAEKTNKKISSIENYLSCKSCNQQMAQGKHTSLKIYDSEFKRDFCNNLCKKFNYKKVFGDEYRSISHFLEANMKESKDTFTPEYERNISEIMTKEEKERLFDIKFTSKENFIMKLSDVNNIKGSFLYLLNLAIYAFDRNLINDCEKILTDIANQHDITSNEEFLHLKAKILSSKGEDNKAIEILSSMQSSSSEKINIETSNLLAASIKRQAYLEFEKYSDEKLLLEKLLEAKEIYASVFHLSYDYYPALNYIYILFMVFVLEDNKKETIQSVRQKTENIWEKVDIKINDWWSFISTVEYLILQGSYAEAINELKIFFEDPANTEMSDFNLLSTIRQLKLYSKFFDDKELKAIIEYLENVYIESTSKGLSH